MCARGNDVVRMQAICFAASSEEAKKMRSPCAISDLDRVDLAGLVVGTSFVK